MSYKSYKLNFYLSFLQPLTLKMLIIQIRGKLFLLKIRGTDKVQGLFTSIIIAHQTFKLILPK